MVKFDRSILWLIVLAFTLSLITNDLLHNTMQYSALSDLARYQNAITNGTESRLGAYLFAPIISDPIKVFFIILLAFGWLIYSSCKDWTITLLSLTGFSVSLMLYFMLLAQAFVLILALFLWLKVEPKGLKSHAVYFIAIVLMTLSHSYGLELGLAIFLIKRFEAHLQPLRSYLEKATLISFAAVGLLLLFAFFPNPERMSFFFPFILPISLGSFDIFVWYAMFTATLYLLLQCKNNAKELMLATVVFVSILANYLLLGHHLEIDLWRTLAIFELISLARIGIERKDNEKLFWWPIILLLLGIDRLLLGLLV